MLHYSLIDDAFLGSHLVETGQEYTRGEVQLMAWSSSRKTTTSRVTTNSQANGDGFSFLISVC